LSAHLVETRRRPWRGPLGTAALAVLLPLSTGCYSYAQVPVGEVPVGETVRLMVARRAAPELLSLAETPDVVPTIRGRLEGKDDQFLLLRVPLRSEPTPGTISPEIGQLVRVPSEEVLSMELQHFSSRKTTALVVGTAAATAAVIFAIIGDSFSGGPGDPPNPDVFLRLARIPIG